MAPRTRVTAALRAQRFDAGSLALNLMATVGRRGSQRIERLPDTASLRSWCQTSRLDLDEDIDEAELLERLRHMREQAYTLTRALVRAEGVDERDLEAINAAARFPTPARLLVAAAGSVEFAPTRLSIDAVLSVIARDLAHVLGTPELRARLHECYAEECRLIFLAPVGREQRWCSKAQCGNRAKVAAHRARAARMHQDPPQPR
ncbi:CGNR zinc finger domain-containing protein [Pseudonocardia yunnanensis]|uniref:CGNR zinc finger domain-containing protein n=1 Tax=Pseudonocardia yunnanensis TaxID=58107 RepID=A0ABW4F0N1_9PSEU